ncbi:MAG: ribosomal protein L3 [uncultured bacterium]|nr:MAG: ribosomal protein L3 [uncultured bacterium]
MNTLFGTKGTMTQTFIEGSRIPVTKISLGPCTVTQIKNEKKDGYWAIQLSLGTKKTKNITKPLQGHSKKSETTPRYLKEIRLDKEPKYKVGDVIKVSDIFKAGDIVSVTAINKGKGFEGGVRRFNFRGGPKTHGQSDRHRAPGSIGQTTTPGRVYKGKRMAGRMGGVQVTIKNVHVIAVNDVTNEISISSPLPGRPGRFMTVVKTKAGSLEELRHEVVEVVVENTEAVAEEVKETPNEG